MIYFLLFFGRRVGNVFWYFVFLLGKFVNGGVEGNLIFKLVLFLVIIFFGLFVLMIFNGFVKIFLIFWLYLKFIFSFGGVFSEMDFFILVKWLFIFFKIFLYVSVLGWDLMDCKLYFFKIFFLFLIDCIMDWF